MAESGCQQFFEVIRDEALKVSQYLDRLEERVRAGAEAAAPVEDILGSDLLGAIERNSQGYARSRHRGECRSNRCG